MPRMRLHNEDVLVIGLGRFGGAVATELHRLGNRVTALELDPRLAESYLGRVGRIVQGDATSVTTIEEIKPHAFSASVLAIGSSIEASARARSRTSSPSEACQATSKSSCVTPLNSLKLSKTSRVFSRFSGFWL